MTLLRKRDKIVKNTPKGVREMNAKICQYKNNARGAFSFVFDDGCYGESTEWTYDIFKSIFERTGIKFKATSAQTVSFISPNMKKLWDKLFDEGYYDLCAHSITHCIGYNKDTPPEELHRDAKETQDALEKMYGIKPLTYVTPGGGSDSFGWDILKGYYIANRNGNDRINIPGKIDWFDIGTYTAMLKRSTEEYIENIDQTIENGGWSVQINHWITKKEEDKFHSQSYETFVNECDYLAKKAAAGDIWVCSMNECVLYLQEAEKSTLEINGNRVTLLCPLDKDIYNYPLTVDIDGKLYEIKPNETITV